MNHRRPENPEIAKRVWQGYEGVKAGARWIAVEEHFSENCAELFIDDEPEFWQLVMGSLSEIKQAGPPRCYAGWRPPEKAGEAGIKGLELWPFRWTSEVWREKLELEAPELVWNKLMYLKFVIRNDGDRHSYGHVDIHKNRP